MKRPLIIISLTALLALTLFLFISRLNATAPADRDFAARQAAALRDDAGAGTGASLAPLPAPLPETLPETLPEAPRYSIEAHIDPDAGLVAGKLRLVFTNPGEQALDALVFRLYPNAQSIYGGGSLEVTRATQAGHELSPTPFLTTRLPDDQTTRLPPDPTIYRLPLARPLPAGQSVAIELDFTAHLPELNAQGYGIFARSPHVLVLAGWYPILAPYSSTEGWLTPAVPSVGDALQADISFYEVSLSLPAAYQVAGTGSLLPGEMEERRQETATPGVSGETMGRRQETATPGVSGETMGRRQESATPRSATTRLPDDQTTRLLVSGPAREFALALSQEFAALEAQVNGVTLRLHTLPTAEAPNTTPEQALKQLTTAFEIFEELYGPYPYREFEVVEAPIAIGGYEFSGMVIVDDQLRRSGPPASYEYILAHELAHQWWYGLAGTPTVAEPWLDEAHATYAAAVYLERAGRPAEAAALLEAWQAESDAFSGPQGAIDQPAGSFHNWDTYRRVVYSRGAGFLHALRQELDAAAGGATAAATGSAAGAGSAAFFELERRFIEQHRFQTASTTAYLQLAQQFAGSHSLAPLIEQYFP